MQKLLLLFGLLILLSCSGQDKVSLPNNIVSVQAYHDVTLPAGKPRNRVAESYSLMMEKYNPFYTPISLQISKYIRHIFQDADGNYWFGTNDDGIARMKGEQLDYFSIDQGLGGRAVRRILQDKQGRIWAATSGGVSIYSNGQWKNITTKDGLLSNDIWSLFLDSKDRVWAGTMNGLCFLESSNVPNAAIKFKSFELPAAINKPESRFTTKLVWNIFEDNSGNIWFGTDGDGVKKYDGKTVTNYSTKDGMVNNNVLSIVQDKSMNMWFSTWGGGLSRFDGNSFTSFTQNEGLSNNNVWSSMVDKEGNLWFGTLGGGVNKYDGKTISVFRERQGLTENHVQSMIQDKDGQIWFGFSGGVFKLEDKFLRNIKKPGC